MKTPLIIMTILFVISFFDGMFMWGLSEGFYMFAGISMMGCVGWMWYIELKHEKTPN